MSPLPVIWSAGTATTCAIAPTTLAACRTRSWLIVVPSSPPRDFPVSHASSGPPPESLACTGRSARSDLSSQGTAVSHRVRRVFLRGLREPCERPKSRGHPPRDGCPPLLLTRRRGP